MANSEAVKQDPVKSALRAQRIETPSWAFGNTGTRFKVFAQPGVPRTPQEKIADAAQVHAFTGVAPSVAVHIPWDRVDDYGALAEEPRQQQRYEVDAEATCRGDRCDPRSRRKLLRMQPEMVYVATPESVERHPALPHRCTRRARRCVFKMRTYGHLIQLL